MMNLAVMNTTSEIENRAQIQALVEAFYAKIRVHDQLGPIFNAVITDWEEHFVVLTDFWETQLFLKRHYTGNPVRVHQEVDRKTGNVITSEHFGLWLNLWFATIDELYHGEIAWIAKNRAQKMSTMLFLKIHEYRTSD